LIETQGENPPNVMHKYRLLSHKDHQASNTVEGMFNE